jgi:hypothetical protein
MNLNQRRPLSELTDFYNEHLAKYKTNAAKKAAMTRDIKAQEIWVNDVREAVKGSNWLHGEKFYTIHLIHYENELNLMHRIKSNIN